ncbi:recombinase family protein [Bacillus sp. ISL-18]|uniref:recombinase family protein n=1 Tax=Bacillus sp. ISL-18 TaxID=2819118 RepID=UPI001BEC2F90|nr:recombinase family protein [Bacillus sp. ISL-18]MBT2656707.1 recombinase family protein [Bacillus sp. ISL-18]
MLIKTVAIYNRISRDNGESDDVLLNHRTIIKRLCEEKGYQYQLYEEVESGGKFEERTQLLQLLKDIDKGLYDGLVVVELSRIARDNLYSQMIAKVLEENGVLIITPSRTYNLSDESDRLMYDMESMISSKELRTITRRMRVGKLEGVRRGEWIQGVPPLGYSKGDNKKLVIVESEASLVRMIFNYAENGYGIQSIVKKLEGYKTKAGKSFTDTAVYTILNNKTYTGSIIYNVKDKKGNITETILTKNAHEPIITREQFKSVQQAIKGRMSGNLETRNRSRGKILSILKDLVYCNECGLKMGFRKDSKQKNAIYLKACKCGNRGVVENLVLDSFMNEFYFLQGLLQREWKEALKSPQSVSKDTLLHQVKELKKTQDKLNTRLSRAKDAYLDGVFNKEEYLKTKNDVESELKKISVSIDDLLQDIETMDKDSITSQYKSKIEKINRFHEAYNKEASQQDFDECNRILKLIINKIHYARVDEKVTITSPLEGYMDVEQGDFVELSIESK